MLCSICVRQNASRNGVCLGITVSVAAGQDLVVVSFKTVKTFECLSVVSRVSDDLSREASVVIVSLGNGYKAESFDFIVFEKFLELILLFGRDVPDDIAARYTVTLIISVSPRIETMLWIICARFRNGEVTCEGEQTTV